MSVLKKSLLTIGAIGIVIGCGGGSKEAEELLEEILQIVGIPPEIIVNICQDDDDSGFCEATDTQTLLSVNKEDNINKVLQKIQLEDNNTYRLENYNKTKNILLEMQDRENIHYDDGNFTFTFNGETTRLSLLQSMVDSEYLKPEEIAPIQKVNGVKSFRDILFKNFRINYNKLRDNDMLNIPARNSNLEEMAKRLRDINISKGFPQILRNCNGDQSCIDNLLTGVSNRIQLNDDDAKRIPREAIIIEGRLMRDTIIGKTLYMRRRVNDKKWIAKLKFKKDGTIKIDDNGRISNAIYEIKANALLLTREDRGIEEIHRFLTKTRKFLRLDNGDRRGITVLYFTLAYAKGE